MVSVKPNAKAISDTFHPLSFNIMIDIFYKYDVFVNNSLHYIKIKRVLEDFGFLIRDYR